MKTTLSLYFKSPKYIIFYLRAIIRSDSHIPTGWTRPPACPLAYLGKQGALLPDVMGTKLKLKTILSVMHPPSLHHTPSVRITTTCGLGSTGSWRGLA